MNLPALSGPNLAYAAFVVLALTGVFDITGRQFVCATTVFLLVYVVEGHVLRPALNKLGTELGFWLRSCVKELRR